MKSFPATVLSARWTPLRNARLCAALWAVVALAPRAWADAPEALAGDDAPLTAAEGTPAPTNETLESTRRTLRSTTEWLARGVDSWFGPKPFEQGGRVSDGRLSVGFLKRQDTGIASVVRFNGQLRLPNVEKFGYVFLGRADQRDIVTDTPAAFSRQQRLLNNRPEAPSFVAGLGWSLPRSIDLRLGFRGGLKPYAQAGYSHSEQWHYGTLAQFRQTLFWARDDQLGSTTAVSLEKPWSSSLALRWLMAATITQQAPKFDVSSLLGAYKSFGDQRLLSLEALAHGVQSSGVGLSDYGVQVKWAQPVYRSWLVAEVLGGYFWPRPEPELPRGHAWALGGSVMMRF